jgi:hypothetical protein
VLTLDQALGELAKVTPEAIQRLASELFVNDRLCMSVITPPRTTNGLEKALAI